MKDGVVLVILGVIGIGGFLLWQAHVDPFHPAFSMSAPVASRAPEPSTPAPKPASPRSKPAPVAEVPVVAEVAPEPEASPAPPAVPHDPPPFPAVDEIASGAPEDTVTTKFGDPAISALTSSGGHILGTYVYARDKGREATVIQLEDGKVASAYSMTAPVPASGLSIPRHPRAE